MYKKLTDNQVKNLGRNISENEFVVSHVGDGEYSCNVFGNIYSSYWRALKKARDGMPNRLINIYIADEQDYHNIFICDGNNENYDSYWVLPKIARLTVEHLNSDFDLGQ